MSRRIEVFANKGVKTSRHKNGFNFRDVEPSKRKKKVMNVLVMGRGYDAMSTALKQAKVYSRSLKNVLPIWVLKNNTVRVIPVWKLK